MSLYKEAMEEETKDFGARVARLSPQLALGLGCATGLIWVLTPAPAEFWIGNLILGSVAGLFAVKLYKTGDGMYVIPYALLVGMFPFVSGLAMDSFAFAPMFGGLITLVTGISLTIAARRHSVLEARKDDA